MAVAVSIPCVIACLLLVGGVAAAQHYVISTFAGGAVASGPEPATNAAFSLPARIAADQAGNVYFSASYCVFKIDTSGRLTRVAGTGKYGYSGDGGPGAKAQLSNVNALAVDGAGNLFIADGMNARIRRVSAAGVITTVAGTGTYGYAADGGTAGAALGGGGVAVDGEGNLYIPVDYRIRKLSPSGAISAVAGVGIRGSSGDGGPAMQARIEPRALAVDGRGNLYLTEDYRVRRYR